MHNLKRNFDTLQQTFQENPLMFLGVAAACMTGAAKLIEAVTGARSRSAYAKAEKRRQRQSRRSK